MFTYTRLLAYYIPSGYTGPFLFRSMYRAKIHSGSSLDPIYLQPTISMNIPIQLTTEPCAPNSLLLSHPPVIHPVDIDELVASYLHATPQSGISRTWVISLATSSSTHVYRTILFNASSEMQGALSRQIR
jgi:hypothetical protein